MLMGMSPLVVAAGELAIRAHIEHKNKFSGDPYLIHLWRVSSSAAINGEEDVIIAALWLHDAIEDEKATYQEVLAATNREVADLAQALAKPKGMSNEAYYRWLASQPKAARCKWYDLTDNFPKNHLLENEADLVRTAKKYSLGMDILRDFAPGRPLVV